AWNEFREIRFSISGRRIARSLLGDRKTQRGEPRIRLGRARRPAGRQGAAARLRPHLDRARSQPWPRRKGEDRMRRGRAAGQFEAPPRFAVADRGGELWTVYLATLPPRSLKQVDPGRRAHCWAGCGGLWKASRWARGPGGVDRRRRADDRRTDR